MSLSRVRWILPFVLLLLALLGTSLVAAQLPPEAVDLSKVKIPERQKSMDLCPVALKPSDSEGPTWSYKGVEYRGLAPDSESQFLKTPDRLAEAARRERWIYNFMMAMSSIWCPITDEVTPGGRKQVDGLGYKWESCCSFCDEEMREENFTEALDRLRERAEESYKLTGGVYTEGAKSPVEGAIREDV